MSRNPMFSGKNVGFLFIYIGKIQKSQRTEQNTLQKGKKLRKTRTKCRIRWTIQLNIAKNPKIYDSAGQNSKKQEDLHLLLAAAAG